MKSTSRAINNAMNAEAKLHKRMSELTSELSEFIEFEFSISFLAGDGLTLLNNDTGNVAFIGDCILEIKGKQTLTEHAHEKMCI